MNVEIQQKEIGEAVAKVRQMLDTMGDGAEFHSIVSAIGNVVEAHDTELGQLVSSLLSPASIALERSLRIRQSSLELKVNTSGSVAFVTSLTGMILAASPLAMERFSIGPGDRISRLGIAEHTFASIIKNCEQPDRGYTLVVADGAGDGRTPIFATASLAEHKAIFITALDWTWPDGLADSLRQSFSLTERELQVLAHLMTGESAETVAERSGRSIGTVRQQVKSILSKLNVSSQMQAVALVAAAASAWQRLQKVAPLLQRESTNYPLFQDVLRLDARSIGIRRFGLNGGTPVIVIHGAIFVPGSMEQERQVALQMGLDVICVQRPGYGPTSPATSPDAAAPTAASDVLAVINHLSIGRAIVIAHDIGCLTAFQLATLAPDRVVAIVAGPTTPPMLSWKQTQDMPRTHRLHAWAAQNAPRLMHLLVTLGLAHVGKVGTASIPDLIFGGCTFDRDVWSRPEFEATLPETYRHILAHNGKGFWQDMLMTNHNWTDMAVDVTLPVELLHGENSQTVSRAHVEAFASKLPNGSFLPISNGGHTMPLTHFELIFERAKRMVQYI